MYVYICSTYIYIYICLIYSTILPRYDDSPPGCLCAKHQHPLTPNHDERHTGCFAPDVPLAARTSVSKIHAVGIVGTHSRYAVCPLHHGLPGNPNSCTLQLGIIAGLCSLSL